MEDLPLERTQLNVFRHQITLGMAFHRFILERPLIHCLREESPSQIRKVHLGVVEECPDKVDFFGKM